MSRVNAFSVRPTGVRVPSSVPPWPGSSTIRRTATGKRPAVSRVGTVSATKSGSSRDSGSAESTAGEVGPRSVA